jgi:hypothetical protein
MSDQQAERLAQKTEHHRLEKELVNGYGLSRVEAAVLATRVQELAVQQITDARQPGQIIYPAVAIDEPPGKPLTECRKVNVHLTLYTEEDSRLWATAGTQAVRQARVKRIVDEAVLQGGVLSQEDIASLLGCGLRTVRRIFAVYRARETPLLSRGEVQDMGRGVSHKVPVIRRYVQDVSFTQISWELGKHGVPSMERYLRHFALVMILTDHGLSAAEMQSVVGISLNLIRQYQNLYRELDVPAYAATLQRLKRSANAAETAAPPDEIPPTAPKTTLKGKKRGQP